MGRWGDGEVGRWGDEFLPSAQCPMPHAPCPLSICLLPLQPTV
ncbi:histidine kinase [Nostoc linckia]|nr:histidine kinase [Nostoc linckia]